MDDIIADRLQNVRWLFIDTSPIIYYVERNERYLSLLLTVFGRVDQGLLTAVTSAVTLAECLVHPYRKGLTQLCQDFLDLIVNGRNTMFATIDQVVAQEAARLRAHYNLTLADAFQVAVALDTGCEAFLTNDVRLKRVSELDMIVLDELE